MDPFILTIWYLVISGVLLICKGGYLYGLAISEAFFLYCLWNYDDDDCAFPLVAVIIYLIVWFIIMSGVYTFWLALVLFLIYCLIFVLPVVLWLHFH